MGDNWAKVELYRWQHGELPPDDGTVKPLDIPQALHAGAKAMSTDACPSAFNVATVLGFTAARIKQLTEVCEDSNAVCVCGCDAKDHEQYDDDGEACEHEDHECIRTSRVVAGMGEQLTADLRRERERAVNADRAGQ